MFELCRQLSDTQSYQVNSIPRLSHMCFVLSLWHLCMYICEYALYCVLLWQYCLPLACIYCRLIKLTQDESLLLWLLPTQWNKSGIICVCVCVCVRVCHGGCVLDTGWDRCKSAETMHHWLERQHTAWTRGLYVCMHACMYACMYVRTSHGMY